MRAFIVVLINLGFFVSSIGFADTMDAIDGCETISMRVESLKTVERKLFKLERVLKAKSARRLAREIRSDVNQILKTEEVHLDECHRRVTEANVKAEKPTGVTISRQPTPIEPEEFLQLMQRIKKEELGKKRLEALESAASYNYFSVEQVRLLLKEFADSEDKLHVLKILKEKILDKKNLFMIYSAFELEADRQKAMKILEDL